MIDVVISALNQTLPKKMIYEIVGVKNFSDIMTLLKNLRVITLFYIEENKGADLVNALSYSEAKLYVFSTMMIYGFRGNWGKSPGGI